MFLQSKRGAWLQLQWDVWILLPRLDRRLVSHRRQIGLGEVQDLTLSKAKANVIPQDQESVPREDRMNLRVTTAIYFLVS